MGKEWKLDAKAILVRNKDMTKRLMELIKRMHYYRNDPAVEVAGIRERVDALWDDIYYQIATLDKSTEALKASIRYCKDKHCEIKRDYLDIEKEACDVNQQLTDALVERFKLIDKAVSSYKDVIRKCDSLERVELV